MTARTMAGEWPANIGWRAAAGKGRHHRPDTEASGRETAGKGRHHRPDTEASGRETAGKRRHHRPSKEEIRMRLMARHGHGGQGGHGEGKGHGRGPLDRDDLERMAILRHLSGGGRGGRGGPFGGGRGRGRRRRGDVRAALLMLLAEEPMNGYQLMQTIEERSGGRWRPSPGSVYPSLAQLEDEGLIRSIERDGAKLFEITDAGREHLATRHEQRAPWDQADDPAGESPHELRALIPDIAAAIWQVSQVGDEAQMRRASELLAETRRSLYRILAEDDPEPAENDPEPAENHPEPAENHPEPPQDNPEPAEAGSDDQDERVTSGNDD
jgi:DNA-binding PadR family transcriptional regulator